MINNNIGEKVRKLSGLPFKSTLKENTIKSIIKHPKTGRQAYTFEEDDSYVEIRMCAVIKGK